jgi:ATP-dependent DNA ligase
MPYLEGRSLEDLPLRDRKVLLKKTLDFTDPLRYTAHRNEKGESYFEQACNKGWEGIIAKRANSAYRSARTRDWLKFKCAHGQELVIGGFTSPQGSRVGFGALLVGYYEDGDLVYAGKVGTGYDNAFLADFRKRLDGLARDTSPFVGEVNERDVHWVAPKLVGEFGFTEWTKDGKLRHPRFLGLRRDKAARDVGREAADD